MKLIFFIFSFLFQCSYNLQNFKNKRKKQQNYLKVLDYQDFILLEQIARPETYYTQGFKFFDQKTILESGGLYGQSSIQFLDIKNKFKTKKISYLHPTHFGEGIAVYNNQFGQKEIHQLTWLEQVVNIYDENLTKIKEYQLPQQIQEGWGLDVKKLKDSEVFYVSNGSDTIFIVNPENWQIVKQFKVKNQLGQPQNNINELQFIGKYLYANIYLTNQIVKINTKTGNIIKNYDMTPLVNIVRNTSYFKQNKFGLSECLNGIAYNKQEDTIFVTGKKWPYVFKIQFKENN